MSENLTQCAICRTLIPPEKAAAMAQPLLCDGCRERQAQARSPEFPFATFIRFKSSVRVLSAMLMITAIVQFLLLPWHPVCQIMLHASMNSRYNTTTSAILAVTTLPQILLWNILVPILLLMLRSALLAFSDMMSDMFMAVNKDKL